MWLEFEIRGMASAVGIGLRVFQGLSPRSSERERELLQRCAPAARARAGIAARQHSRSRGCCGLLLQRRWREGGAEEFPAWAALPLQAAVRRRRRVLRYAPAAACPARHGYSVTRGSPPGAPPSAPRPGVRPCAPVSRGGADGHGGAPPHAAPRVPRIKRACFTPRFGRAALTPLPPGTRNHGTPHSGVPPCDALCAA